MMTPFFEEMSEKYAGECIFVKIDADKCEPIAQRFGFRAMPTFILLRNGEKVSELIGASKEKLGIMLEKGIRGPAQ